MLYNNQENNNVRDLKRFSFMSAKSISSCTHLVLLLTEFTIHLRVICCFVFNLCFYVPAVQSQMPCILVYTCCFRSHEMLHLCTVYASLIFQSSFYVSKLLEFLVCLSCFACIFIVQCCTFLIVAKSVSISLPAVSCLTDSHTGSVFTFSMETEDFSAGLVVGSKSP